MKSGLGIIQVSVFEALFQRAGLLGNGGQPQRGRGALELMQQRQQGRVVGGGQGGGGLLQELPGFRLKLIIELGREWEAEAASVDARTRRSFSVARA